MCARSSLLAAGLAVLAAACGSAAAAPLPPAAAAPVAASGSVQLLDRLAERGSQTVPDVTRLTLPAARVTLGEAGLTTTVIRFGKGDVTAQWPDPGQPQPADGAVVVWTGTPPQPRVAKAPKVAPAADPVASPPAPPAEQTAPVQAVAAAPAPAPASAPAPGGRTPGLESMVPPPHGSRANIRTLAPAPAGTTLQGRASWYGPGFAGHTTACGGVFDPGQLTLASRELRCGTVVTVTGPNGRAVEATVTDWGPAEWTNRRFDLSQATMAAVAGLGAGVVDVTVEVR